MPDPTLSPAQKAANTRKLRREAAAMAASPPAAAPAAVPEGEKAPHRPAAAPLRAPVAVKSHAPVIQLRAKLAFVASAGDLVLMLRAALMFVSKDPAQPSRRIVRFESDGSLLRVVSTNGHCLYVGEMPARQSELTAGELDVHVDSAIVVHNALRKWQPTAPVLVNADQARLSRVSNPKDAIDLHGGDAPFVPWKNLIGSLGEPGPVPTARVCMHAQYIACAVRALAASQQVVWTTYCGELQPVRLAGETIEHHPAIVMIAPCRG
jgi:hypothetical protein